jgi:pimeloyl-ACP methyl ester carboxylesterase
VVPLEFTFEDMNGQPGTHTEEILVCPPPVMLVHGFTGNRETWSKMADLLRGDKRDAVISEYFTVGGVAASDIQSQARLLQQYIQLQKQDYARSHIKLGKTDVVCHSMGGLLTRWYVEQQADYRQDVRKIVMVATPNHGVEWWQMKIGGLQSLLNSYHEIASQQLYKGSDFFKTLNAGEATGGHLMPDVQYATLIGRRRNLVVTYRQAYAQEDGVVSTTSAWLNGVWSETVTGVKHSPALPYPDVGITESPDIWDRIRKLLAEDIPRQQLRNAEIRLTGGRGDVRIGGGTPVSRYPAPLDPWQALWTGEGQAIVQLFLDDIHWGSVFLDRETELLFDYASPRAMRVLMKKGQARFLNLRPSPGQPAYTILTGTGGREWHEFDPRARVYDVNTDFVVAAGEQARVWSREGTIIVEQVTAGQERQAQELNSGESRQISPIEGIAALTAPPPVWWSEQPAEPATSSGSGERLPDSETIPVSTAPRVTAEADAGFYVVRRYRTGTPAVVRGEGGIQSGDEVVAGPLTMDDALAMKTRLERRAAAPSPPPDTPPAGLVLDLSFDSIAGDTIRSQGPRPVNGFIRGKPLAVDISSGRGLELDGRNDFIVMDADAALDLRGDMTILVAAQMPASILDDAYYMMIWRGDDRGGHDPYGFSIARNQLQFRRDFPLTRRVTWPMADFDFSGAHVLAAVHRRRTQRLELWVDGRMVAEAPAPEAMQYDTSGMRTWIGAQGPGTSQFFRGVLQRIQVYDRALSPAEIDAQSRRLLH